MHTGTNACATECLPRDTPRCNPVYHPPRFLRCGGKMRLREVGSGPSLSISRRRWLAQSAVAAAGSITVASSSFAARAMWAQAPQKSASDDPAGGGVSHDAEAIHQQVTLPVSAAKIYDVLITADLFQKMSLFSTDVPAPMLTAHPAQLSA